MDAGIYLEETATRALVEHNNIIDNSVGVYIHGAAESMVRENKSSAMQPCASTNAATA